MKPEETPPWTSTLMGTLATTPYFNVLLHDVRVNDGSQRTYYTLDFPGPAVGIVARRDGQILLVRQYRFIIDEYVWAIPSGGIAEGEAAEEAAARELLEETGYVAKSITPLLSCYASYGCSNQQFRIFTAGDLTEADCAFDPNEVLEVRWFTEDELLELIRRNGIVDNLSLSPLLYVLLESRMGKG